MDGFEPPVLGNPFTPGAPTTPEVSASFGDWRCAALVPHFGPRVSPIPDRAQELGAAWSFLVPPGPRPIVCDALIRTPPIRLPAAHWFDLGQRFFHSGALETKFPLESSGRKLTFNGVVIVATAQRDQHNEAAVTGLDLFNEDGHLKTLLEIEADVIQLALKRYDGCLSRVARHLRIGRSTVYRKVEVAKWVQERTTRREAG